MALGLFLRCLYYSAWKMSEAACIMCGLGYAGQDPKDPSRPLFNRVENISIRDVEFASNPRMLFDNWNKNTASWLKRSIYTRVIARAHKPSTATYLTYFSSALWHGFKPGYYLCFLTAALMTLTGRALRRHLRPLFTEDSVLHPYKPIYDFLGWLGSMFLINYCVMPFYSFTFVRSFHLWKTIWFSGHILMISVLVASKNKVVVRTIDNLKKRLTIVDKTQ